MINKQKKVYKCNNKSNNKSKIIKVIIKVKKVIIKAKKVK